MNSIKVQVNMNKPTQSSSGPKFGVGLTLRLFYVVPSFMTLFLTSDQLYTTNRVYYPRKREKTNDSSITQSTTVS